MKKLIFVICLFASSPAFAQNVSTTQMQLNNQRFQDRIAYLLSQQAIVVKAEALATTCHTKRSLFADSIISAPQATAQITLTMISGSTNVVNTVIAVNGTFDSSASDAALLAQVATLWNALSKCDTGS